MTLKYLYGPEDFQVSLAMLTNVNVAVGVNVAALVHRLLELSQAKVVSFQGGSQV